METQTDNQPKEKKTGLWIGLGIGATLLLCLCVVGVIGGAVYIYMQSDPSIAEFTDFADFESAPSFDEFIPTPADLPPDFSDQPVPESAPETLNAIAAMEVPSRDRVDLAVRLLGMSEPPTTIDPPDYQLGDIETFWVSNLDTDETLAIEAELAYIADNVYMWVEKDFPYDEERLARSAELFSSETYETNRSYFGSEPSPGVDGDPRLHILHSIELGSSIAGYFGSSDAFPEAIVEFSNQREMFFINISNTTPGTEEYDSVLAHEFQHMIHWSVDRNEESWLNEGMSELAAYLNGYGPSGFSSSYLNSPNSQLTTWPEDGSTLPHYGGAYLFLQYFLDRFGQDATRALVANTLNGMESVDVTLAELGEDTTADELFADWVITNLVNDGTISPGIYTYPGLSRLPQEPALAAVIASYPHDDTQVVRQYGVQYISLEQPGDVTITFDGAQQVRVIPADTNDTDNDPSTEDSHVWWSNRGDDSDMTLTREVDLTGVDAATLSYDLWFWIEYGWDYGYVEVSTDGGETFDVLETPYTADYNPFGNAYGVGYTGQSADFPDADVNGWVHEEIDLSAYARQKILLRFEMITDDAVNQPGFAIDNLCIDAIDFCDNAEEEDAGWDALGFVRHSNIMPQKFVVQVVVPGDGATEVIHIPLDENNQGAIDVTVSDQPATLVVSGLTRFTTEPAIYDYEILPQ